MRDLAMQCAMDLAETALMYGQFPDAELLYFEHSCGKRLERRRLAAKDARDATRLRRQCSETRTCPCCGGEFRVMAHGGRGRLREYCGARCRNTAKMRRWREAVTRKEVAVVDVCSDGPDGLQHLTLRIAYTEKP